MEKEVSVKVNFESSVQAVLKGEEIKIYTTFDITHPSGRTSQITVPCENEGLVEDIKGKLQEVIESSTDKAMEQATSGGSLPRTSPTPSGASYDPTAPPAQSAAQEEKEKAEKEKQTTKK